MNRFFLVLFAALLASSAMADNKQTVVIDGHGVDKTVKQITFNGDNVVLTFTDESTLTEDMSLVKMSFAYGPATGITSAEKTFPQALKGNVYNLNGQLVGTSTKGLGKGIYIVDGKKLIIK